jgi:hypothetical protein
MLEIFLTNLLQFTVANVRLATSQILPHFKENWSHEF